MLQRLSERKNQLLCDSKKPRRMKDIRRPKSTPNHRRRNTYKRANGLIEEFSSQSKSKEDHRFEFSSRRILIKNQFSLDQQRYDSEAGFGGGSKTSDNGSNQPSKSFNSSKNEGKVGDYFNRKNKFSEKGEVSEFEEGKIQDFGSIFELILTLLGTIGKKKLRSLKQGGIKINKRPDLKLNTERIKGDQVQNKEEKSHKIRKKHIQNHLKNKIRRKKAKNMKLKKQKTRLKIKKKRNSNDSVFMPIFAVKGLKAIAKGVTAGVTAGVKGVKTGINKVTRFAVGSLITVESSESEIGTRQDLRRHGLSKTHEKLAKKLDKKKKKEIDKIKNNKKKRFEVSKKLKFKNTFCQMLGLIMPPCLYSSSKADLYREVKN